MQDLLEPYSPVELDINDVREKVQAEVNKISLHYSKGSRCAVNLLIYFNQIDACVSEPREARRLEFDGQGWASVSVVGSSWAYVFSVSGMAPIFIANKLGQFKKNTVYGRAVPDLLTVLAN